MFALARWAGAVAILAAMALGGCATDDEASGAPSEQVSASQAPSVEASASESASESAEASPSEDAAATDPEAYFDDPPDGYELSELPREVERTARRQFEATPGIEQYVTEMEMRSVTPAGDDEAIGLVMAIGLEPEVASLPGTERGFASGVAGEGARPRRVEIAGETAYVVEAQQQVVVNWQEEELMIAAFLPTREEALAVAEALMTR